ncbi:PKD domain-containing protein [Methanoregula sp.]|uniref:EMC6-like membrane protein n=1 Tax=Methanoregula sp. TaxID=2052170 RepID=UPI002D05B5CF|nr:PKD domain-containing protein [Methanoregula sp.]HVP96152.1 PKD domain-containing protein [Methanoregula sp.]
MTDEVREEEQAILPKKKMTKLEKQAEHIARIKKTLVACIAGILVGCLSWYLQITVKNDIGLLAFMLMLAGVVLQRHIFVLMHIDTGKMGAKDWLYQGFMTFAFWIMTWTILLSTTVPVAGFSANVSNGTAPLNVVFADASTNTPAAWNWSFGDGTYSEVKSPEKTYASAGNFTVNLTVQNTYGTNTLSKTGYISVLPAVPS